MADESGDEVQCMDEGGRGISARLELAHASTLEKALRKSKRAWALIRVFTVSYKIKHGQVDSQIYNAN